MDDYPISEISELISRGKGCPECGGEWSNHTLLHGLNCFFMVKVNEEARLADEEGR